MKSTVGILILVSLLSFSISLKGEEIKVLPSKLKLDLMRVPKNCKILTITGTINEADQQYFNLLPKSVSTLDLSQLTFPQGKVSPYIFLGSSIRNIILPDNLEEIGEYCFAESALDSIFIHGNVKRLGEGAFYNCRSLKHVSITSDSLDIIERYTFCGCDSLQSVDLSVSINSVEENGFKNTRVSSLKLPNAQTIGAFAFAEMPLLEEVVLPVDVEVGDGAFYGDQHLSVIPLNLSSTPALAFAGTGLKNFESSIGGDVIGAAAFDGVGVQEILLNANVKKIENHAFRNMKNLNTVDVSALGSVIPETAPDAFSGVNTNAVTLLTKIGMEGVWANHPVWGEFNSISGIAESTNSTEEVSVSMEFNRSLNWLRVTGNRILNRVIVYDIEGNVLLDAIPVANVFEGEIRSQGDILLVDVRVGTKQFIKKIFNGKE